VKKKYIPSSKDKKDWIEFTENMESISVKKDDLIERNVEKNKVRKLDLHGYSLIEANKEVKKFILESFELGCKKLLIVTGKGSRSKSHDNPYLSEKLSVLKYSVPEYIRSDENLNYKISKITQADLLDGGEGAINIFLKTNQKFIK
jgi:DNA-nicking Smr family endonuclease